MAKISMMGNYSLKETIEMVKETVPDFGSSVELKDEILHVKDSEGLALMVFEKYYWRNDSYTSLTVCVSGDGKQALVDAIGAGGGDGFLNFSWGSEEAFTEDLQKALEEKGFENI